MILFDKQTYCAIPLDRKKQSFRSLLIRRSLVRAQVEEPLTSTVNISPAATQNVARGFFHGVAFSQCNGGCKRNFQVQALRDTVALRHTPRRKETASIADKSKLTAPLTGDFRKPVHPPALTRNCHLTGACACRPIVHLHIMKCTGVERGGTPAPYADKGGHRVAPKIFSKTFVLLTSIKSSCTIILLVRA